MVPGSPALNNTGNFSSIFGNRLKKGNSIYYNKFFPVWELLFLSINYTKNYYFYVM